ncbi:uroporphyrinogen-III synthase [Rhodobacterales bacterium HKCCE2091]|nr:uroporphyrinogen-III synthase [Rhodobacterales bacterium HKCCE2091]
MADNGAPLILLTRPCAQSERFAETLRGLAEIRIVPLMEIVTTGPLPDLSTAAGLIFTSENGVRAFAELSPRRDLPSWAVGGRTRAAAEAIGLVAREGGGTADTLVDAILVAPPDRGRLWHLRGTHATGDVAARLRDADRDADEAVVYDQRACAPSEPLAPLAVGRRVVVPLFSPRSARLFAGAVGSGDGDWVPVCLSEAVAAALPDRLRRRAAVADSPDAAALARLLQRHISP